MANIVELVRRMIRQSTNNIGEPVANIYGALPGALEGLTAAVDSTWLKATIPGADLPTIDDFFALWATAEVRSVTILNAQDGAVSSQEPEPKIQLIRGAVSVPYSTKITLAVSTGTSSGEYGVYLNGVLQRKSTGELLLPLALDAGTHLLEILAATRDIAVALPPHIKVTATNDAPGKPRWDSVRAGWLDARLGTPATEMRWSIDRRAGGWRILRRSLTLLSRIITVGDVSTGGVFGVTLDGDQSNLGIGDEIHALHDTMGVVLSAAYDDTTDTTSVLIRLSSDRKAPISGWVGTIATTGLFVELRRVRRQASSGQVIQYDADVITGQSYEYALQAYGLFDESKVSPLSDIAFVRAGDVLPPGPIVIEEDYPKVVKARATVRFLTPDDDDYDGVTVEYREKYTAPLSEASSTGATFAEPMFTDVTAPPTDFTAYVIADPTTEAAVAQSRTVTAFVSESEFQVDTPWDTVPSVDATIWVFANRPVMTDKGIPDTPDELTFDTTKYGSGEYLFRTFDFGGNTQDDVDCVIWTFESNADEDDLPELLFVVPPVPRYDPDGVHIGWEIRGAVDEDTNCLVVTLSDDLSLVTNSIEPLTYVQISDTEFRIDMSADDEFYFDLDQEEGAHGLLAMLPTTLYDDAELDPDFGIEGVPYPLELDNQPLTLLQVDKVSDPRVRMLTFSTRPKNAELHYRFTYAIGSTPDPNDPTNPDLSVPIWGEPGLWYVVQMGPLNGKLIEPSVPVYAYVVENGVVVRDERQDVLVEYFCVAYFGEDGTGVSEQLKREVIDGDDIPEFKCLFFEDPANYLGVTIEPDEDVVQWKWWAKRSVGGVEYEYPWEDATALDLKPNDLYLKFTGSTNSRIQRTFAKAGLWASVVRGYDAFGNYREATDERVILGVTSSSPVLTSVNVVADKVNGFNVITWNHNAAASTCTIKIYENNVLLRTQPVTEDTDGANPGASLRGGYNRPVSFAADQNAPQAEYKTFGYKLELYNGATLLRTYTAFVRDWYLGTGAPNGPPTETPGPVTLSSKLTSTGEPIVKAEWTNNGFTQYMIRLVIQEVE